MQVAYSWHESLKQLLMWDAFVGEGRVMRGGEIKMRCGTGGLIEARNTAATAFIRDETRPDWFMWVDTDMGFEPDSLERLLAAADPVERPIMGGLCFAQKETVLDGYGGFRTAARPTISDWVDLDGHKGFMGRAWYPPDTVVKCSATGAAFLLIHRTVLEKVHAEYHTLFDRVQMGDGQLASEDMSFCIRAGALGYPVHVHTGVRTTHMKHVWLGEQDFWNQQTAPPASERCDVIVPVMRRPQNAAPFMESLVASCGLATVHAVYDEDDQDTYIAWSAAGAYMVPNYGTPGTFAQKVNAGYEYTSEYVPSPWLLLVGDDVRFHPGWLDHALEAARVTGADVIGTNDLSNPRVMRGEHATHLLVRRSYIDEHGSSWDGPKIVAHEGYRHWFVDDEIVTAAKQRGVWAMALASKIEHLHPIFGKAEQDDVYELGQKSAAKDEMLYRGRVKAYASRRA